MTTIKLYERLNKLAQDLNEIRCDENKLITRSVRRLQEGNEEAARALLAFDNTSDIIERLFEAAWGCWRDISHACHEEEKKCLGL